MSRSLANLRCKCRCVLTASSSHPPAAAAIRLLAFDLDGTLVDSVPGIVATVAATLCDFGYPEPPTADVTALIGLPLERFWLDFATPDQTSWPQLTERYRALYRQIGIPSTTLFPGVRATIAALSAAGYILTIASSKITPVSRLVLEHVDLLAPFQLLMGNDCVANPKPHAEMLERTLATFNLPPAAALMIGDTTHDLTLGANAGVRTVAVASGSHSAAQLDAARPTRRINQLQQLPEVLWYLQDGVQ